MRVDESRALKIQPVFFQNMTWDWVWSHEIKRKPEFWASLFHCLPEWNSQNKGLPGLNQNFDLSTIWAAADGPTTPGVSGHGVMAPAES